MTDQYDPTETEQPPRRLPLIWRVIGGAVLGAILLVGSFELVYAGKIYPGVTADGVAVGGLSKHEALARLTEQVKEFKGQVITINYGNTSLTIPVNSLAVEYDLTHAVDLAYDYGRQGGWQDQSVQQIRALAGRPSSFAAYRYDDTRLTPYITQISDDIATPVADAGLTYNDDKTQVTPAQTGNRLDLGRLVALVGDRLAAADNTAVTAPVYAAVPAITTEALSAATGQANSYIAGPITVKYGTQEQTVDRLLITSWLTQSLTQKRDFMTSLKLEDLYAAPALAQVQLNREAVARYVAALAAKTDQKPQNAGLVMQDNVLTVAQPSRDGVTLDQSGAVNDIIAALAKPADDRTVDAKLKVVKADVNEGNLDELGIKEQISEGETYFPGSPSTRLTNVRAGASKFNGVVLKPGETFSFGKLLGDVGPETGYVPELVILGDHEEKQYGGGLCQVSSTAFRAALNAGLPITERHNHSFAISYYTWPYAVPGVDATIYYPSVDFKFVNDTGHYILMQTTMKGTDLKFDFFGTKTKTGKIRDPQFVTGTTDATKPSHTVFYRDVLDLDGKVIKTDTFQTYYKSSTDFPILKQFN
jgi:vancomycin resistance protein YoaR